MALPSRRRLRHASDITRVVRRGRRVRSGLLVVHSIARPRNAVGSEAVDDLPSAVVPGGARIAFVAPRTVGTAVVRNRTRRRLQGTVVALDGEGLLGSDVDIVIRLLPPAGAAAWPRLDEELRSALLVSGVTRAGRGLDGSSGGG